MARPKREKTSSGAKESAQSLEEKASIAEQKYQSALLHLRVDYEDNEGLYKELKKILDSDLNALYQDVAALTASAKDKLKSTASAALVGIKTEQSKEDMLAVDGSIKSVISSLELINGQQKQLFQSMQAVKLAASSISGTQLPFSDSDSQKLATQADYLIRNLMTFKAGLVENLTMTHGKVIGLTMEHGKDLPVPQQAALVAQCKMLVKALEKQIAMNQKLKIKLDASEPDLGMEVKSKRPGGPG